MTAPRWWRRITLAWDSRKLARRDDVRAAWVAEIAAHNQLGWGCPHQICPECEDDARW